MGSDFYMNPPSEPKQIKLLDRLDAADAMAEMAKQTKWTIEYASERMDAQEWDAAHYIVIIGDGVHTFNYSMGWGCFDDKQKGQAHDKAWSNVGDKNSAFQTYLNKNFKPKPADILQSMAWDSQNSDQSFDDWCQDSEMDNDSMKAKKIWEACNESRRALQKCFSTGELEEIYEIAAEM